MTPRDRRRAKQPCPHRSGSPERIETMELRYALGLPLHVDGDNLEHVPITHNHNRVSEISPKIYRTPQP